MFHINYRNQALALCLTAGLTASAGLFNPLGTADKDNFPFMPKAESTYTPKAVDKDGNITPDLTQTADYYVTTNTLGSVFTPSGEEWYYTLELDGTRLNPGNQYFVDMDFTGFHIKVYDADMQFKGQAKGDIIRPEGTLKCRSVEVCMNLTKTFFNNSSADYEVMVSFVFNPGPDADGNPRYGAKETTQVYSLTDEIPAGGSKLLFQAPGYYTSAINLGTPLSEKYTISFIEDTSWDGEDVAHTDFVVYKAAGYGTPAKEIKRFTVHKLYAMSDGTNDSMPFTIVNKGNDIYVAISVYEKTFLVDPTASEPVQNPDNNYIITLYKSNGDDFEVQSTTKIKVETPAEGYSYRSYALGNFLGADDISFKFGDGETPSYILTVVDSTRDESIATYSVYDSKGNVIKSFGEHSDSFVQFGTTGSLGLQFGFYMNDAEGNYGIVLKDFPSMETVGFVPVLFEYDSNAWSVVSVPARTQTTKGIFYVASVLPTGESGDGANHYVAWFHQDGTLDHIDSMFLGEKVAKVLTYIHQSALNPFIFNTDKNVEYLAWIYRYVDGTRTSLELGIVNDKGELLASRMLPDGHTYPNAYISNMQTKPAIVISYRDSSSDGNIGKFTTEFIKLPLNDFEGEGTVESPYLIKTYGDLNRVRYNLNAHFRITNSIDCSGQTFLPIEGEFTGSIDGGNYDIRNLTIGGTSNTSAIFTAFGHKALFDETPVTARLSNINFVNPTLDIQLQALGAKTLGIIASTMNDAELYNVNILNPTVKCSANNTTFGTVAGYADNVSYKHSYISNAELDIPQANTLGGAFGELRSGTVSKITVTGKINGKSNVGGLIGKNTVGTLNVSDIHVNADIKGQANVGGIAGSWIRERINRVFVEGTISAEDYLGGITGSIGVPDASRENIEDENYAILDNCLVGFESMTAPAGAKYVHRIFGYSCIDLGTHMEWIPDPTDPDNKGEYVEVPAAEETKIGKNYVVTEIDAFGSAEAVSEGILNTFDITDSEWLAGLGFKVADWASEASEEIPWVYGNLSWMPELYFEGTADATMHIEEADITGKAGETIIAVMRAENVDFDNLRFESSDSNIAELADITSGENDGEVKVHVQLNAIGNADITFMYGPAHRAVVHVTVKSSDPVLNFRDENANGEAGSTLSLTLDFDNLEIEDIAATSSDDATAAVSSIIRGKKSSEAIMNVDLKKAGTAELTATGGNATAKILVTVKSSTGVDNVKVSAITYNGSEIFAEGCSIEVFDMQGRHVAKGDNCVNLENLANGIYIVRATDAEGTASTLKINK